MIRYDFTGRVALVIGGTSGIGLATAHPMERMATEEEIASAVLWLCSDGAGYVTGTPLAVDGGFLAA